MLNSQQAFVVPSYAIHPPRMDLTQSPVGWSIWSFTDLDWHLLRGLPANAWLRRYRFSGDAAEAERLLAECEWAERWGGDDTE
jgi:hypothetical protein